MVSGGGGGGSTEVARFHALLGLDARGYTAGMAAAKTQSVGLRTALVGGAGLGAALLGIQLGMSAISGAIGGATRGVIEYETAFTGIRKTVEATEVEFMQLDKNIRDLSRTIPVGRIELARIGQVAGQLGIRGVDNLTDFIETIAMIGPTTDLTTEEAAIGFARLSNIMGLAIEDVGSLASAVVALGNNFATFEPEILNFAQRIAVSGQIVGFSTDQVLALGTALSSLGIRAELGGTAMQRALLTINEIVAQTKDELELLAAVSGLTAEEFAAQWEEDAAGAFQAFLGGLGQAGDLASSVLDELGLASQRNLQALLALAAAPETLADAFNVAAAEMAAPLALTEEFSRVAATTASQMAIFKSEVRETADVIGGVLVDQLNAALPLMTDFVLLLRGEGAQEGGPLGGLIDLGPLKQLGEGIFKQFEDVADLFRDVGTGQNPFRVLLEGDGGLARAAKELEATVRVLEGRLAGATTDPNDDPFFGLGVIGDALDEIDPELQAFRDSLLALIDTNDEAARAEDALRRAREDAVNHVEDVMTTRLVAAFIEGGDAAVAVQRETNAALLLEFEALRPGIEMLTGDIADFTFDMFLSMKDAAEKTAKAVEDEMARLTQSVVSTFAQAAGGNLAGAIGSAGQILGQEGIGQLPGVTALLSALASGEIPVGELNNILQTLLGVAGAPFQPVVMVQIGDETLQDVVVTSLTDAEAAGVLG